MSEQFTAELIVEDYLSGVRIDSFLVRHFRNYTPFRMQRIVRAGQVEVEGVTAEISRRVFRGQRVKVRLVEPPDKLLDAEPLPLHCKHAESCSFGKKRATNGSGSCQSSGSSYLAGGPAALRILYEDPWIVVVDKPAGLVVHPVGEFQSGTLVNGLQHHFDRQTKLPGLLRPGIVHRLDRQTSGVMVVSKHHLAHRRLSMQFQRENVSKTYLALVEGVMASDAGTIGLPIGLGPGGGTILMSAGPDARNPKRARTRYEVIRRYDAVTLVRANPQTGRIHQIRVHLAHIGHPLVGDEFYGPHGTIKRSRQVDPHCPIGRHALHADGLSFAHPITGERLTFAAPLPADMRTCIAVPATP